MAKVKAPYIGSDVKFNVHVDPLKANIGRDTEYSISMVDYDFTCEFFTYETSKVVIEKSKMVKYDDDNYFAMLDTTGLKYEGFVKILITAQVPDEDFPDGKRTEKILIITDQYIHNELFSN